MPASNRVVTRIQDQDDAPALGAPEDGNILVWDNDTSKFVATAPSGGGAVGSVFGRTGAVVAAYGDYAASEIEDDSEMAKASVAAALTTLAASITSLQSAKQDADADLAAIAALTASNDDVVQRKAGSWTNRTIAQLLADLNLGTSDIGDESTIAAASLTAALDYLETNKLEAADISTMTTAASTFGTDNAILRADSAGRGVQSATQITIADTGQVVQSVAVNNTYGAYFVNAGSAGIGLRTNGVFIALDAQTSIGLPVQAMVTAAASTSAIVPTVSHLARASGTPGAGFGASEVVYLETSTTNDVLASRMVTLWNVATHASRVPDGVFYLTDYGGEREIWRGRATGSAAAIGFLGATPVARQTHIADALGDDAATVNAILDVLEAFGLVATS